MAKNFNMPLPSSLTHQHLATITNTLKASDVDILRILDAGCGDGKFITFIYQYLKWLNPDIDVEIYGFDVADHGVQSTGFIEKTIEHLKTQIPDVQWQNKIKSIVIGEKWPYENGFFNFVISNQVLEHVHHKEDFFNECYRCTGDGGFSIHLAPLRHYIYEGHLFLPWVHRIRSHDLLVKYIHFLSGWGLGKFKEQNKLKGTTRSDFSMAHADYVYFWTAYNTESETIDLARAAGFRASFRYSLEFYLLKARQIFHQKYPDKYKKRSALLESILIKFLRYFSCSTLLLEKKNVYKR